MPNVRARKKVEKITIRSLCGTVPSRPLLCADLTHSTVGGPMSEAMQRQGGHTPAWLLFSGLAIGVPGASVNKHAETVGELVVALRGRTEKFGRNSGWCPWPMGLAAARCWRSRGASWAGTDCPRRPTQTTAPRNGSSTLLSCLWLRDVGSHLMLEAKPAGRWRRNSGMATMRPTSGSPPRALAFDSNQTSQPTLP
jgi:hypothetical protein